MKISRLLKTIFMIDFVTGLLIAIKETFKAKKTTFYLEFKNRKTILNLLNK